MFKCYFIRNFSPFVESHENGIGFIGVSLQVFLSITDDKDVLLFKELHTEDTVILEGKLHVYEEVVESISLLFPEVQLFVTDLNIERQSYLVGSHVNVIGLFGIDSVQVSSEEDTAVNEGEFKKLHIDGISVLLPRGNLHLYEDVVLSSIGLLSGQHSIKCSKTIIFSRITCKRYWKN